MRMEESAITFQEAGREIVRAKLSDVRRCIREPIVGTISMMAVSNTSDVVGIVAVVRVADMAIAPMKIYRHYPTVLLAGIWMTSLEALCAIYNHPMALFLYGHKVEALPGKLKIKIYCGGEESPRDECGSRPKS